MRQIEGEEASVEHIFEKKIGFFDQNSPRLFPAFCCSLIESEYLMIDYFLFLLLLIQLLAFLSFFSALFSFSLLSGNGLQTFIFSLPSLVFNSFVLLLRFFPEYRWSGSTLLDQTLSPTLRVFQLTILPCCWARQGEAFDFDHFLYSF
jgi:hypothetical protein